MREIQIPDEEKQCTKEILNFKGFAPEYRKAFFIETSPLGHARINPLLAFLVESKMIDAFGPFATVMDVPLGNPSIYTSITHMRTARVSCGYNLSTMTLETSDVLTWDYQVKVKMREVEEIDKTGNKTGKVVRPLPAHKITTLRKELQSVLCGGSQIFHTAVINESGPDKGISRVVVEYDPDDPRCDDKLAFAKQTVGTLACFIYKFMEHKGYDDSTIKRVMKSCYLERARLAHECEWDPTTMTATPYFQYKADNWLDEAAAKFDKVNKPLRKAELEMSKQVRKDLIRDLNYKRGQRVEDVASGCKYSAHTGDGESSGGSTYGSQRMFRTKDYALKLAETRESEAALWQQVADMEKRNAEQITTINNLHEKMESILKMLAVQQGQQGAPPPDQSGSGAPTAMDLDHGSGGAPQGS
jgi:hypothetical protein